LLFAGSCWSNDFHRPSPSRSISTSRTRRSPSTSGSAAGPAASSPSSGSRSLPPLPRHPTPPAQCVVGVARPKGPEHPYPCMGIEGAPLEPHAAFFHPQHRLPPSHLPHKGPMTWREGPTGPTFPACSQFFPRWPGIPAGCQEKPGPLPSHIIYRKR